MSKLNVGDIVQCSDTNSRHYKDGGVVTEVVGNLCRVDLYMANKNVPFNEDQLIVITVNKISAMPAHGAPYGGTCHIQIGDDVKYIGSDRRWKGAKGKVLNIYKVVTPAGPDYLAALVQVQWGNEEIPCDSLISTAPVMGSHYQAVVDSDGPKYDEDNSEKEPFRHVDLGTDLSGDELMESIRSICGR